ncbi:MAG: hypothetical protein KDA72_00465 [Planctomycetales bacterium]|nr:hypothetical protein [Planctomycetales bacterium]
MVVSVEVHTVELCKYDLEEGTNLQASEIQQWAFLLLFAQDDEPAALRKLLLGSEFEQAIETIEAISARTEDRAMHDQRSRLATATP